MTKKQTLVRILRYNFLVPSELENHSGRTARLEPTKPFLPGGALHS